MSNKISSKIPKRHFHAEGIDLAKYSHQEVHTMCAAVKTLAEFQTTLAQIEQKMK